MPRPRVKAGVSEYSGDAVSLCWIRSFSHLSQRVSSGKNAPAWTGSIVAVAVGVSTTSMSGVAVAVGVEVIVLVPVGVGVSAI